MSHAVLALTLGPGAEVSAWRGLLAISIVFGLLLLAWLAATGRLGIAGRRAGQIAVETTCALGERRVLLVVGVDGRRFLLGATPAQVSLITELGNAPPASFQTTLEGVSRRDTGDGA